MKIIMKQVNKYNIEYYEAGKQNNKTLVFAHGLGGSIDQWNNQISYFSKQYHVIAFSLPGHGESSKINKDIKYSINEYALTIIALLNRLNIDNCIWIGNSMGGVIGYEILKLNPKKLLMIITNGTTPKLIMTKSTASIISFFDKLLIKIMKFDGYINFAAKHSSKMKSVQKELYYIFKKSSPKAIIDSHYMLANYDYLKTINETNVPIIFIKAQYDTAINKCIKKINNKLKEYKNVRFIEFKDVGHVCNLEKPTEYNQIVEKAIRSYIDMQIIK